MAANDPLLKTQQVALSLGVSVSTIKRWVDAGAMAATRTIGKHRLIPLSEAVRFARSSGLPLNILGLQGDAESSEIEAFKDLSCDSLIAALCRGDSLEAKSIMESCFKFRGAVYLADHLIRPVMEQVGHSWVEGDLDVFIEHQASQIIEAALSALNHRLSLASPNNGSLALGCSPEGDPYSLALLLGELCLREAGWEYRNLGTNLPLSSLMNAVRTYRPRLVFLSVNYVSDPDRFSEDYRLFYESAASADVAVAIGGRALGPDLRARLVYASYGERIAHLSEFARRLLPSTAPITTSIRIAAVDPSRP